MLKPNEIVALEEYHIKNFFIGIEDNVYIYVGEEIFIFETNDKIIKFSSKYGNTDIEYSFAFGEKNIYFMLQQKLFSFQEYKKSVEKTNTATYKKSWRIERRSNRR